MLPLLLLLLCCLSLSCVECSQPWSKLSIAKSCGGGENLLCDLDNVLNASEAQSLTSLLEKDLGSEAQNQCLKKIYVVIVKHLANPHSQEINKKMSEAAEYLRREWRISKCCITAVLLLSTWDASVSTRFCDRFRSGLCEERLMKETYGNNSHYLFERKQYGIGLEKFIQAYQEEINNPICAVDGDSLILFYMKVLIILLLLAFIYMVVIIYCCCDGSRKYGQRKWRRLM